MSCVDSTSFAVLVNGSPTYFFLGSRGLRQGCTLSPLLFQLAIEVPRRCINKAKSEGKMKGIKISTSIYITHLLFVDDVLILGCGSFDEWEVYKDILDCFCEASSMKISPIKSSFLINCAKDRIYSHISGLFPFKMDDINVRFKYLGFFIKPNGYRTHD